MSPVLDATEIETEDELTQEQEEQEKAADAVAEQEAVSETPPAIACDPVRSITLALPAQYGTAVTLLVQHGGDDFYRSGFQIVRDYETCPHERSGEDLPLTNTAADEGFKILGEAVAFAADMAAEWLQFNSDDADERAQASLMWLNKWNGNLDPAAIMGDIFDDVPIAVAKEESGAYAGCEVTAPAVSDEAQQHYNDRKHALEEQLGKLSIEQVRLKAAVKCNREAMNTVIGELEDHLVRGPVRLPLFDRAIPEELRIPTINPDGQPIAVEPTVPADEAALDESAEAWRAATIEELGIDPKICQLLRDNNKIETLGQIADHCKDYELTDLKKIGKAKAAQIEQAMDAYWAKHPLAEVTDSETVESKDDAE
jgi:hypothetical protein